ncbi:hypothetical protein MASR1M60_06260 [Rhodocyclaceae bacterium]
MRAENLARGGGGVTACWFHDAPFSIKVGLVSLSDKSRKSLTHKIDAAASAYPVSCRPGCGACCIAPSISTLAKPAGVPCRHLSADFLCLIFGQPARPACCGGLQPSTEMCGDNREQALAFLAALELATR